MRNPFAALTPALALLTSEASILPATGQAIVDLARPDIEELYDKASTGDEPLVEGIWERPNRALYRPVSPRGRREHHLLRYFIDGSAKTYFIGTLLEHERSSPVQLAQVGAAGVWRDDDGGLHRRGLRHHLALLLDRSKLSDALWDQLERSVCNDPHLVLRSTRESDAYSDTTQEQRSRGAHKANWLMREAEESIATQDLVPRSTKDWLVLDGGLGNEYLDWRGAPLLSVVKSFRRDSVFKVGSGPRATRMNLYGLLAGLEDRHRTIVFPRRKEDRKGLVAFWYVRLRPQANLDYPLMGVVKVEVPCSTGEPVESDLADLISSCLIAERSVTPHGRDSRWHAHLYPIAMAERVIKDRFYSDAFLKAAVRWPIPRAQTGVWSL